MLLAQKPLLIEAGPMILPPRIWFSEDRLYVLFRGLWAFDISQPGEPVEIGYYPTEAIEMAAQGGTIALADSSGRVEIVRIVKP